LLLDTTFRKGFACLAPLGQSFDTWLFHPQIGELTDLARAFLTQKSCSTIAAARSESAAMPTAARKFSRSGKPRSAKLREAFGPDRCMFESNFPARQGAVQLPGNLQRLQGIAAQHSEEEKTALFFRTAMDFYRLKLP
jgi:hypothetical protein